jgi:hypothetical protein
MIVPGGRAGVQVRSGGCCGVALQITVWQLRHSKVSKSARSSRDLLACMAMPQTGQWRTRGRGLVVNFSSVKQGGPAEANIPEYRRSEIDLDQCRCVAPQRPAAAGKAAGPPANCDLGQCDRDLELAVIDDDGPHALVFPCRRILNGWMKVETRERLDVRPTHWRDWQAAQARSGAPGTKQGSG